MFHFSERTTLPKQPICDMPICMGGKMPRNAQTQHAQLPWRERCPEQPKRNMPIWMKGKDAQNSQNATCLFEWKKDALNTECPTCPEQSKRNMPIGMKGKMPTTANVRRVHCKGGKCRERPKCNMPCQPCQHAHDPNYLPSSFGMAMLRSPISDLGAMWFP